ncbi:putative phage abortive infection protein [Vibrio fluvialis]|uniref:putative phage abortive infection protein n=1 Tax=Vibrio fluvialis TaxID=676 RepID=UPI001558C83F|nr:putative phage abortive infection protein [Vibrio fluvialis]
MLKKILSYYGIMFLLISIALFILVSYFSIFHGNLSGKHSTWGEFGSFFGGVLGPIVSILAFIGLLLSMDQTKKQFKQQSEESSFYALLNFHHSKLNQTIYKTSVGVDAFKALSEEFKKLYDEECFRKARKHIQEKPADLPVFAHLFLSDVIRDSAHGNLVKDENIVVGYFALGSDKGELFKGLFDSSISEEHRQKLNALGDYLIRKLSPCNRLDLIGKIYDDRFYPEYGHIVGHYFRNLYYVLEQADSSDKNGMYAKILRAQLSRYELNVLFYNSLSTYSSIKFNKLLMAYDMFNGLYSSDVCYLPEDDDLKKDLDYLKEKSAT